MAETGRVLALDHGDARIGVAISDPNRRMAVPLGTVRTGAPNDLRAIAAMVREKDVSLVVVGHPIGLRGDRGPKARQVEGFAEALRAVLPVPVELHDERLSTAEATRELSAAGVKGRRLREAVDENAATVILRSWLKGRAG
jgi:putative Holliday junction resolvase